LANRLTAFRAGDACRYVQENRRKASMQEKDLHELLAKQGIRLFVLSLGSDHITLIHHNKSVEDWRKDIRNNILEINHLKNQDGCADDEVFNEMMINLRNEGYFNVTDIVADVYEGRIAVYSAGIEDDPSHEEQADGFGHYGWESKRQI
jgi:hypothetical protein